MSLNGLTLLSALGAFFAFASGCISIAMIAIIRSDLWYYSGWWWSSGNYYYADACYMTTSGANLCSYGYVVGGLSVIMSVALFFVQIAKLRPSWTNHSKWEMFVSGAGLIWWLPFAVVATVYGVRATDEGLPLSYQRRNVWILAWTVFGCFCANALVALFDWNRSPKPVMVGAGNGPYGPPTSPGGAYSQPPQDFNYSSPVYGQPVGMNTYSQQQPYPPPSGNPPYQAYPPAPAGQAAYPPQQNTV